MKRKNKDTLRLDWLQRTGTLINQPNTGRGLFHACVYDGVHIHGHFYARTVRGVIDLAIEAFPAKEAAV